MNNTAAHARSFLERLSEYLETQCVSAPPDIAFPDELHIELTYKCDEKCIMCNIRDLRSKQKVEDISLAVLKEFLAKSPELKKLSFILLSGGEPWLHPEFKEILFFFRKKYPETPIMILSNLANTDYIIRNLKSIEAEIGLKNLSLGTSIDGIGDVHDSIRGLSGAYISLMTTVGMIREKFPALPVSFNFTLIPENVSELYKVYSWSRDTANFVSFQMLVQKQETREFSWDMYKLEILDKQIDMIIEHIWSERFGASAFEPKRLFEDLSLLFLLLDFNYMYKYLKNPRRFFTDCPCGHKFVMINPEGFVYMCPVHKDMFSGNINKTGIADIWNSPDAEAAKGYFEKKVCHCWLSCTNSFMLASAFFPNKGKILKEFNTDL